MKTQLIFKYIGMGIIAMLLAMCNTGGGDTGGGDTGGTGGSTTIDISTYTLSYETTPQGTATTLSPTWNKAVSNATYAINHDTAVGNVIAPTIDESTGEVTIATDTTAGYYTITATGSGNYTGEKTTTLPITVATARKAALTTAINAGITAWGNEGDFNYIITSAVADMSNLFEDTNAADNVGYQLFNGDISKWDTSTVSNMSRMFYNAKKFNQPIGNWNTSKVENMSEMFLEATEFNQPIGNWNTNKVTNMYRMFNGATEFDQDIKAVIDPAGDGSEAGKTDDDRWNTSEVTNMQEMFYAATKFDKPIGNWNTSKVQNMSNMFQEAKLFNQPIGNLEHECGKNMSRMFNDASAFDQDIKTVIDPAKDGNEAGNTGDDRWNTSAVQDMQAMFLNATEFNQKIDNWNVGAVETGKDSQMFTKSGMDSIPCWYDSNADSGNGGIHDTRPTDDCLVAFAYDISTYTFSYQETPQGTATTLSPTWNKDVSNTTYEISYDTPVGTVIAPTIDKSTGEVTIATDTTAGYYTITATGSGNYTGEKTTTLPIIVATASKAALTTAINAGITAWGNEGDFNYIITSTITDMSNLFEDTNAGDNVGYQLFNGDISKWDTSTVSNMSKMFDGAKAFNQPIGNWNTSAVQNMSDMFNEATAFNQPIGNWNTSAVTDMGGMFYKAALFNQDIKTEIDPAKNGNGAGNTGDDRWNTSAVKNMHAIFYKATLFNKKIDNWNVGAVEADKAAHMFTQSGMDSIPCWYNSGIGAIRNPRPDDCPVAD